MTQAVGTRAYSEAEVQAPLHRFMAKLTDETSSPRVQLMLKNAVLTLLELHEEPSFDKAYELVANPNARSNAAERLSAETPRFWSNKWDSLWRKDEDPLLSDAQQRMARRIGLQTFWAKEYDDLPPEIRAQAANALKMMAGGASDADSVSVAPHDFSSPNNHSCDAQTQSSATLKTTERRGNKEVMRTD